MFANYGLKVLKLAIIIINASYFAGMFWLIFCELTLYFNKKDAFRIIQEIFDRRTDFNPVNNCGWIDISEDCKEF